MLDLFTDSRIIRFKSDYLSLPIDNTESKEDRLERLGYQMFVDDISKLRRAFLQSMYECLES